MVPQIELMSVALAKWTNNLGEGNKISNSYVAKTKLKLKLKDDGAPHNLPTPLILEKRYIRIGAPT